MLVRVEYDKDRGWVVDESSAMIFPEFRDILKDKDLGVVAMAYIAMGVDNASDNPIGEAFDKQEDRLKESCLNVWGEENPIIHNPKVLKAISKYERIIDTAWNRLRQSVKGGIENVSKYIDKNGDILDEKTISSYVDALIKIPKVLEGFESMKSRDEEHLGMTKTKIKANKELGLRARKFK